MGAPLTPLDREPVSVHAPFVSHPGQGYRYEAFQERRAALLAALVLPHLLRQCGRLCPMGRQGSRSMVRPGHSAPLVTVVNGTLMAHAWSGPDAGWRLVLVLIRGHVASGHCFDLPDQVSI